MYKILIFLFSLIVLISCDKQTKTKIIPKVKKEELISKPKTPVVYNNKRTSQKEIDIVFQKN